MDQIRRLFDAARRGDVAALQQLQNEDPQILERVVSSTIYTETPLHVAALAGKTDFARELITQMFSLATEKNQEGLIPLHIASARGHLEMVRDLLTLDSSRDQCLLKGQGGRIPLHDAIIKGRVAVIEHLISHCAESLEQVTESGETVLHLAAMNNQSEALEVVIERLKQRENFSVIFNAKDKGGNTFWDIGQLQTREKIEFQKRSQIQNAVLVVAALIVTVTFQACLSPPPTLWKEGRKLDIRCMFKNRSVDFKGPPDACLATLFYLFMLFNTTAFLSAVILIGLQIMKRELILLLVSIGPLLCNYVVLQAALCPDYLYSLILFLLSFGILALTFAIVKLAKIVIAILKTLLPLNCSLLRDWV